MARLLSVIAAEINRDWGDKTYFGAVPYVSAMLCLSNLDENYYEDRARDIVIYFLSNANTWRGPKAREIKAELREMLKN